MQSKHRKSVSIAGNENIYLIGSSNAIGVVKSNYEKGNVVDKSKRGLSVVTNSSMSYLNFVPKHSSRIRLILVIGSNEFNNNEYSLFKTKYVESLCELFKSGYHNHQILVVLPMVRGSDVSLHSTQLRKMRELKIGLKFLKVASVCWDDLLPKGFNRKRSLFGKRDMQLKKFVHYSEKVKNVLADFIEKVVSTGFDEFRLRLLKE